MTKERFVVESNDRHIFFGKEYVITHIYFLKEEDDIDSVEEICRKWVEEDTLPNYSFSVSSLTIRCCAS